MHNKKNNIPILNFIRNKVANTFKYVTFRFIIHQYKAFFY
jgi:hypothetical protein